MYFLTTYNSSGTVSGACNISDNLDIDRDSIEEYLKNFKSKYLIREYKTEFASLTSPNQNLYVLYSYIDGMILYINNKMSEHNTIDLIETYPDYDPFYSSIKLIASLGRSGCTCNTKALFIIVDIIKDSIYNSGYDLENLENDTTTAIFDVVDFNEVINTYLNS